MNKITIKKKDNCLIISGDIDIFKNNRTVKFWFGGFFDRNEIKESEIIVFDRKVSDKEFLNRFKKGLIEFVKDVEFDFDENFNSMISEYVNEEENFQLFSKKALEIQENDFSSDEFLNFSNYLKNNFERRLYPRQLLSAYHLAFSQHSGNFSVPGSGKTTIVYAAFKYLNGLKENDSKYINKIIVAGPQSSFEPWEKEYEDCFGVKPNSFRLNGENNNQDKINALRGSNKYSPNLFLIFCFFH